MRRFALAAVALAATIVQLGSVRTYADRERRDDNVGPSTATPIKHVIVIIGENRMFDNLYGTYVPKHGQHVSNLLSKGIVRADGTPGANSAEAEQFRLSTIDPLAYFIDTNRLNNPGKMAYAPFLPTPEAGGAPPQAVTLAQFLKSRHRRPRRSTRTRSHERSCIRFRRCSSAEIFFFSRAARRD